MTINVLRGRGAARRRAIEPMSAPQPEPLPIGDESSEIFNCPACSRPLAVGARRCPGCATRLLLRVQAKRAAVFFAAGTAAGLVVAAALAALAITLSRPADPAVAGSEPVPLATAGSGTTAVGSAAPAATAAPPEPAFPTAALSALEQTAEMNARLAAGIPTLTAALAESSLDTFAVARVLRSMTADAAYAAGAAARLGAWDDAAGVSAGLAAVYAEVRATALEGLATSLANEGAYHAAATRMLQVMAGLVPLDIASRKLAADAGIDLPAVDLIGVVPGAPPDENPAGPAAP